MGSVQAIPFSTIWLGSSAPLRAMENLWHLRQLDRHAISVRLVDDPAGALLYGLKATHHPMPDHARG
jgi:hypothetical protein